MGQQKSGIDYSIPAITGGIGRYYFDNDQRNGFRGSYHVAILDRDPQKRIEEGRFLRVVPLVRTPSHETIPVAVNVSRRYAVIDAITTANPDRLRLKPYALSMTDVEKIGKGLSDRFFSDSNQHQDNIIRVPTASSPAGRFYVVLAAAQPKLGISRLSALPVDIETGHDFQIRSFGAWALKGSPFLDRVDRESLNVLKRDFLKDLGIPVPTHLNGVVAPQ